MLLCVFFITYYRLSSCYIVFVWLDMSQVAAAFAIVQTRYYISHPRWTHNLLSRTSSLGTATLQIYTSRLFTMASQSFSFPQGLLHSLTEPQWLPRSRGERESRLDALEREQEEFVERLTIQVLPTPPEPIGIAGRTDTGADADGKDNAPEPPLVDLTALPATLLFWDKHRETVNRLRDVREGIDTYQPPDRPLVYKGRMSLESMESATSSFSLDSPTSRTG